MTVYITLVILNHSIFNTVFYFIFLFKKKKEEAIFKNINIENKAQKSISPIYISI